MYCNAPPAGSDKRTDKLLRNSLRILRQINLFAVHFSTVAAKRPLRPLGETEGVNEEDMGEIESEGEERPSKRQRAEDWPLISFAEQFNFDLLFEDGSIEDMLKLGPLPARD